MINHYSQILISLNKSVNKLEKLCLKQKLQNMIFREYSLKAKKSLKIILKNNKKSIKNFLGHKTSLIDSRKNPEYNYALVIITLNWTKNVKKEKKKLPRYKDKET